MRTACGQREMGKLLEDMGFDTIVPGTVGASKVEEDRRVVQLVSSVSVCGEYLITGWEILWSQPDYFYMWVAEDGAARQRDLSTIKKWWELAKKWRRTRSRTRTAHASCEWWFGFHCKGVARSAFDCSNISGRR